MLLERTDRNHDGVRRPLEPGARDSGQITGFGHAVIIFVGSSHLSSARGQHASMIRISLHINKSRAWIRENLSDMSLGIEILFD
jgi:hypothetical protein